MKLPDLSNAKMIGLDIETYDPDIKTTGPGVRRNGYIVGISVSDGIDSWYLPFRHTEGNAFEEWQVKAWARDQLESNIPKVGANLLYDLDYLYQWGVKVGGPFYDVQNAEPLLNENKKSYSLEALSQEYLGVGKFEEELDEWVRNNLGSKADPKANIFQIPGKLVSKYARYDALLPLQIFSKQIEALKKYELWDLFELESELTELLLLMRQKGVRINEQKAEEVDRMFTEELAKSRKKLFETFGEFNINAASDIAKICDSRNIRYPRTYKTDAPSFTKAWMEAQDSELFRGILAIRKFEKYKGTFIEGSILGNAVKGRIHCQFNQLRSDFFGTVTGRFSSSNPNLQNIPARDPEFGPLVRSLFIPEPGHDWYKLDYSAVEPRISMHYAQGIDDIKKRLYDDPTSDIYQPMMDMLPELDRKKIKTLYLGISYGMGKQSLADALRVSKPEAEEIIRLFNSKLPYLSELSKMASNQAKRYGYVRTLLRRFRRFPNGFQYKALNAVIQGGSADIMKKSMVDYLRSGLVEEIGVPLLTVHDELDFSIPPDKKHLVQEIKSIMENAIKLTVPLNVDVEVGPNWGEVK